MFGEFRLDNINVSNNTTSVKENIVLNETLIQISPNPTEGLIHIKNESNVAVNFIEVIDALGKVVVQTSVSSADSKFDISTFENGIYFIKIKSEYNEK